MHAPDPKPVKTIDDPVSDDLCTDAATSQLRALNKQPPPYGQSMTRC